MPSVEHDAMVEQIVATGMRTPEEPPTAELLTAMRDAEVAALPPAPVDMDIEETTVGGVPCVTVTPRGSDSNGTIVFVHGGGYIWMRAHTHLAVAIAMVRSSGCRCVNVDYRRRARGPVPRARRRPGRGPPSAARRRDPTRSHRVRGRLRGRWARHRRTGRAPRRRRGPSCGRCEHLAVDRPRGHRRVGRPRRRPHRERRRTADDGRRLPRGHRPAVTDRVAVVRRPPRAPTAARPGRERASLCSTTPAGSSDAPASTGST